VSPPHTRCSVSLCRETGWVHVLHLGPAANSISSLLSPLHPRPGLLSSSFPLHPEKRGLTDPQPPSSNTAGPAFTMAAFSLLGFSPGSAPHSLPLPSSTHKQAHTLTQLPSALSPAASCPPATPPAWWCDSRAPPRGAHGRQPPGPFSALRFVETK
jgi:hypothetical protein